MARQGVSLHGGPDAGRGHPPGRCADRERSRSPTRDLSDTVVQSIASLAAIGLERARGLEAAARAEAAQESGAAPGDDARRAGPRVQDAADVDEGRGRRSPGERPGRAQPRAGGHHRRGPRPAAVAGHRHRVDGARRCRRLQPAPNDHSRVGPRAATLRQFEARLDGHAVVTLGARLAVGPGRPGAARPGAAAVARQRGEVLARRGRPSRSRRRAPRRSTLPSGTPVRRFPSASRRGCSSASTAGRRPAGVPGTGMGLAIVRQIAEAHRGTLSRVAVRPAPGPSSRCRCRREGARS